ncbi:Kallmann syndrome, partial [Sigmodon hispidus]
TTSRVHSAWSRVVTPATPDCVDAPPSARPETDIMVPASGHVYAVHFTAPDSGVIRTETRDQDRLHVKEPWKHTQGSRTEVAKPENVSVSFTCNGDIITGHVSWDVAEPGSHVIVGSFHVTWMDVVPAGPDANSVPKGGVTRSRVVPGDRPALTVTHLRPATRYHVQVTVLTPATGTFHKPELVRRTRDISMTVSSCIGMELEAGQLLRSGKLSHTDLPAAARART